MRILQAIAGAPKGGAENFFVRLVVALKEAGIEQQVLMRPDPVRGAVFQEADIPFETAEFNRLFPQKTKKTFQSLIQGFSPDLVLTWMSRATDLCPTGSFTHVARLGGYYDLKYYKNADHLIGNTTKVVDYLCESGWPRGKTTYIPNFAAAPKEVEPCLRRNYDTPPDVPLLLTFGRLHRDKGFDTLISVLAQIPEAFLWIGGEGDLEKELKGQAKKLGVLDRVRFLGWQEDTAPFYRACDVYVCPSRVEPLGNVVIEAWSYKCPVVAVASDGPKGLIEEGKNGILTPLENPYVLGEGIKKVLKTPELLSVISERGFETYQENFTKEKVVAQYLDFFREILKQKRVA